MLKPRQVAILAALITLLLSSGCNYPLPEGTERPGPATASVLTVQARMTESGAEADLPVTETQAAQPGTAGPTTMPGGGAPSETCTNLATFVQDITIRDYAELIPGESFTKIWTLKNSGTCTWTPTYAAVFMGGSRMDASLEQELGAYVPPGESINLQIEMSAPQDAGIYQGFWKLRTDEGRYFGLGLQGQQSFWVRVVVRTSATPPVAAAGTTPTSTPLKPSVWVQGSATLEALDTFDLDSAARNITTGSDIALSATEGEPLLNLLNGAQAAILSATTQQPGPTDCSQAAMLSDPIALQTLPEQSRICYRTDQARLGILSIAQVDGAFQITFITWSQ
jgi:hypothetical protein